MQRPLRHSTTVIFHFEHYLPSQRGMSGNNIRTYNAFSHGHGSPDVLAKLVLRPEHFSVLNGGAPAQWQSRQRTQGGKGAGRWRLALLLVMDENYDPRPLSAAVDRVLGDAATSIRRRSFPDGLFRFSGRDAPPCRCRPSLEQS